MSDSSDELDVPRQGPSGDTPTTVVHIVVLGDIARSPRMQYHALKLVEEGFFVQISGYWNREDNLETIMLPPLQQLSPQQIQQITWLRIQEPPQWINSLRPRILSYFLKLLFLATVLFFHLLLHTHSRTCWYLLQCPPAVPTFLITWLVCCVRNSSIRRRRYWNSLFHRENESRIEFESKIAIDWHNYGFTLMQAAAVSSKNMENSIQPFKTDSLSNLGRIYRFLEVGIAKTLLSDHEADWSKFLTDTGLPVPTKAKAVHFAVTRALQKDLHSRGVGPVSVLYDRPTDVKLFRHTTKASDIHDLFTNSSLSSYMDVDEYGDPICPLTEVITQSDHRNVIRFRSNRPFLLVSSCSWSVDDDFGPLLEALDRYVEAVAELTPTTFQTNIENDEQTTTTTSTTNSIPEQMPRLSFLHYRQGSTNKQMPLPKLLCIITGRGPLKEGYLKEIAKRAPIWNDQVRVITPWLAPNDYPKLLGVADLGVCLHRSTSGLDLPMKVVDMFAAKLPVLSLRYMCIHELVLDGWNGYLFSDSEELFHLLSTIVARHEECCMTSTTSNENICCCSLMEFRRNLATWRKSNTWDKVWKSAVLPRFTLFS